MKLTKTEETLIKKRRAAEAERRKIEKGENGHKHTLYIHEGTFGLYLSCLKRGPRGGKCCELFEYLGDSYGDMPTKYRGLRSYEAGRVEWITENKRGGGKR